MNNNIQEHRISRTRDIERNVCKQHKQYQSENSNTRNDLFIKRIQEPHHGYTVTMEYRRRTRLYSV